MSSGFLQGAVAPQCTTGVIIYEFFSPPVYDFMHNTPPWVQKPLQRRLVIVKHYQYQWYPVKTMTEESWFVVNCFHLLSYVDCASPYSLLWAWEHETVPYKDGWLVMIDILRYRGASGISTTADCATECHPCNFPIKKINVTEYELNLSNAGDIFLWKNPPEINEEFVEMKRLSPRRVSPVWPPIY